VHPGVLRAAVRLSLVSLTYRIPSSERSHPRKVSSLDDVGPPIDRAPPMNCQRTVTADGSMLGVDAAARGIASVSSGVPLRYR